jgi:hypothetical protein
MLDAKRLLMDALCVAVLAVLMAWGAESIAAVPLTLPPATAASDCNTPPAAPPKEVTVAGGLPGLNLADCGDKEKADKEKSEKH